MDRPTDSRREEQSDAERKLLTALCQATLDPHTRAKVVQSLKTHTFVEPDYEVIYRALAAMPAGESAEIRATLGPAVTRLGFPDVDLDPLFSTPPPTPAEVAVLLERL